MGATVIAPLAASVIVIVPEFEPLFVSKIKSCAPLVVSVAFAPPEPITVSPDPFGLRLRSTFVSPLAPRIGPLPVAPFVTSNSLTASVVFWKIICSFPLSSAIKCASSIKIFAELVSKLPPNCGVVSFTTLVKIVPF